MKRLLTCLLLVASAGLAVAQDDTERAEERATPERRMGPAARAGAYAGNLGRFGGAMTVAEAAGGVAEGNQDRVRDAFRAVVNPEFLVGLSIFDGAMRVGEAATRRLPNVRQIGQGLKNNLVLAGAMTVASSVDVDLNGFSYRDLFRGDFSDLRGASVGFRPIDPQSLGITMGSFAIAQPIWRRGRALAGRFGRIVLRRLAVTAAVKAGLAVAPVPGTRVAALLLTAGEVGLAVLELAGVIGTAQAIEAPIQEANNRRRQRNALDRAEREARAARSPEALNEALARVRQERASDRSQSYQEVAQEDLAMIRRLRELGYDNDRLNEIATTALEDYGPDLALPALTALLDEELNSAPARFRPYVTRYRERVAEASRRANERRDASYAREQVLYRELARRHTSPEARAAIAAARDEARLAAEIEGSDLRVRSRTTRPMTPERPAEDRTGINDALRGGTATD